MPNLNKLQHFLVEPAQFRLDGGAMFGIIPKPLWNRAVEADEQNRIDLALRLWLIETEKRFILIDTGIGDYHGEKFDQRFNVRGGKTPLRSSLEKMGRSCDEITDLVISHLHFDHVGGIGEWIDDQMVPLFKKARCHLHRQHYEYALQPTLRDAGSFHAHYFEPVINYYREHRQLHLYEGEEGELFELNSHDKLKFKVSHGHTPYLMHPYNRQYIYLTDLIPTSHHVPIAWVMGYDISPGVSAQEKQNFLQFIHKENLKIIFEHDPHYWGSTIALNEKGHFINGELFKRKENPVYALPSPSSS